ncbi:GHKL domain-containing protein [Anaerobacillus sp. HL2]|nr:GHKL domain-containing protein [Anaerobacillus sp. HL2]
MINGDEKLIGKALSNILSNAIKYTADGEKIEIKLGANERDIRLTVMNANTQIDVEHLKKIFEPFYQIEKSRNRKTGGSGLGLYIVKKILDMHKPVLSQCVQMV